MILRGGAGLGPAGRGLARLVNATTRAPGGNRRRFYWAWLGQAGQGMARLGPARQGKATTRHAGGNSVTIL